MPSITLSQIKVQVYSELENNDQMYQPSEVTNAINQAIAICNITCGWFNKTLPVASGASIANRVIYRIPDSIIIPQKCTFEGKYLETVSLYNMGRQFPNWLKDNTTNTGQQVSRFIPYTLDRFAIHPADSIGGASILITGISNPIKLISDSDTIVLPKDAVLTVAKYAAHIVQCKLGGTPFLQSIPLYRMYEKYIKQEMIWADFKAPTVWFDLKKPE